jgi:uncharacterized membrane protein
MKKMIRFFTASAVLIIAFYSFYACKQDKLPVPEVPTFCDSITATYTDTVKAIIDSKCSVAGCHLNTQNPNLNNYTQVFGSSDRIAVRALDLKTMPPLGMTQLTEDEIKILTCWREAGFPEN